MKEISVTFKPERPYRVETKITGERWSYTGSLNTFNRLFPLEAFTQNSRYFHIEGEELAFAE